MGLWSKFVNGVKAVGSAIASGAKAVWEGAKKVASKVIDTVSEYGGKFAGAVKEVFKAVKPYLSKVKTVITAAGAALSTTFPWAAGVAAGINKGIDFLDSLGNSAFVQKVGEAIEWALNVAKTIKDKYFSKTEENQVIFTSEEEAEAIERQKVLDEAYEKMETEAQRRSVRFASIINQYSLVKSRIEKALESFESSNSTNFDHYLRLRATQKLLAHAERRLKQAQDLSEISADDLFLIQTGNKLLAENPSLTDEEAVKLDKIVNRRFGKSLLPFVFEELIHSWGLKLESMKAKAERLVKASSTLKNETKRLRVKERVEGLTPEEMQKLESSAEEQRAVEADLRFQTDENRNMERYVFAAEGFLQVLEKTEDYWVEQDREWVIEDSAEVGMLLIQTIEGAVHWDDLTPEQQSIIRDFANVFSEDSKHRKEAVEQAELGDFEKTVEVL